MDEAATKNNCYLCSLNGRALTECCILGSEPREYLNGHGRNRSHLVCKWSDEKYKEGSAERAAKVKEALKVRGYALKRFSMRKKKMRSTNFKIASSFGFKNGIFMIGRAYSSYFREAIIPTA